MGCAGPKTPPQIPLFGSVRGGGVGGGPERPKSPQTPIFTGETAHLGQRLRSLRSCVCVCLVKSGLRASLPVGAPCYNFITALESVCLLCACGGHAECFRGRQIALVASKSHQLCACGVAFFINSSGPGRGQAQFPARRPPNRGGGFEIVAVWHLSM